MTLETTVSKAVYTGNGATTEFPFSFKVWDEDQILISVTDAQGYVQEAGKDFLTRRNTAKNKEKRHAQSNRCSCGQARNRGRSGPDL